MRAARKKYRVRRLRRGHVSGFDSAVGLPAARAVSSQKLDTGERGRDMGRAVNEGANPRGSIPKPDTGERWRDVGQEIEAASHVGEAASIPKLCAGQFQVS